MAVSSSDDGLVTLVGSPNMGRRFRLLWRLKASSSQYIFNQYGDRHMSNHSLELTQVLDLNMGPVQSLYMT